MRSSFKSVNQQKGLSLIAWLIGLVFVGFYLILALKLVPVYTEHAAAKQIIRHALKANKTAAEIQVAVKQEFNARRISTVSPAQLTFSPSALQLEYDVKVPIIVNITALIHFNDNFYLTH